MSINIKATNIELTSAIEEYIKDRLSRVEKFIKDGESANTYVEVGKTTNHHKQGDFFRAEINIEISGKKFYTFSEKEDLYNAIDETKEEIIRQITNKKDRKQTLFKRGALRIKRMIRSI